MESAAPLFESEQHIQQFAAGLRTVSLAKHIDYRPSTGSTNDLALEAGRAGEPHGKLFVTDEQSAGRGRRGRNWESPPGKGLLFSVLVRLSSSDSGNGLSWTESSDTGWVPLVAGVACVEAVQDACRLALNTKWPNDLVVPATDSPGWRKVGGILCESVLAQTESAGQGFVVIGVGLNVNHTQDELPQLAKAPPSSLYLERARVGARLTILSAMLERLEIRLRQLCNSAQGGVLKDEIRGRLFQWWHEGRTLNVQPGTADDPTEDVVAGKFGGLDEFGRLKLIEHSGRERVFADAEILSIC